MTLQLNPWLTAWKQPRKTIQAIVEHDPTYYVLPLAGLAGIGNALDKAALKNAGHELGAPQIVMFSVIGGFISGIVGLYIFSFALRFSSRWLGGAAPRGNLRAAIAWGALPLVLALLIWIPQITLFGADAFVLDNPASFTQPIPYWSLYFLELTAAVWAFIAMSKMVGEVNHFSAWRGLGAILVGAILLAAALIAIVAPFVLLSG